MQHQRKAVAALVCLAMAALLVAGCGSSKSSTASNSDSTSQSASSSSTSNSALIAEAKTKVAQYETNPSVYPGPTTAFKPGHYNAAVMGCPFEAPICAQQAALSVQALHEMGWSSGPAQNDEDEPSVIATFLERAAQQHLAGVVMWSVPLQSDISQAMDAVKAGVIIVCPNCASPPQLLKTGKVFDVGPDWTQQGVINSWAMFARTGDKTKAFGLDDPSNLAGADRMNKMDSVMNAQCSECFTITAFNNLDAAKPGPPEVTGLLSTHPVGKITDIVTEYDGLSTTAATTVRSDGRSDICVSGFDGTTPAIDAIASDSSPICDVVAESPLYDDWAAVDILGRTKAGVPLWKGYDDTPSVLIEKNNAKEYLNGLVPSGNWQAKFKKLWGAS